MIPNVNVMFVGAIIYFYLMSCGCSIQGEESEFREAFKEIEERHVLVDGPGGDKETFVIRNTEERERIYAFINDTRKDPRLSDGFGENYDPLNRTKRSDKNARRNGCKKHPIQQLSATIKQLPGTEENFIDNYVKAHNDFRALHGVPPLKLDPKLSEYAQNWADDLARRNKFEHSGGKYGENLYMVGAINLKLKGIAPVQCWYDEIKNYKFGVDDFKMDTGHFTAVVWKDTKRLGVGVAEAKSDTIVVGSYDPPGNVMGMFKENVLPPIKKSKQARMIQKATALLPKRHGRVVPYSINPDYL